MGNEYRLRFNRSNADAVVDVLRRVPTANETVKGECFELAENEFGPGATINVEPGGAYFCDHCGGSGRAMLGEVVARLASAFGAVTVEEL